MYLVGEGWAAEEQAVQQDEEEGLHQQPRGVNDRQGDQDREGRRHAEGGVVGLVQQQGLQPQHGQAVQESVQGGDDEGEEKQGLERAAGHSRGEGPRGLGGPRQVCVVTAEDVRVGLEAEGEACAGGQT